MTNPQHTSEQLAGVAAAPPRRASLAPFSEMVATAKANAADDLPTVVEQYAVQDTGHPCSAWLTPSCTWSADPARAAIFTDWETAQAISHAITGNATRVETRQTFRMAMPT